MTSHLDHAALESLRHGVTSTPGRIAAMHAFVRGLATLIADLRSPEEVAAFASALADSGPAFSEAVETMPASAAAMLPVSDARHERVNAMGWPIAGTVDDDPRPDDSRPAPVVIEGQVRIE